MTGNEGDGLPPLAHYDFMFEAADRYRARFGEAPPIYEFMGWPAAVTRELAAAVARGEPLTSAEMYRRIGVTPPAGATV
jgi:hypothetical protein